MSGNWTRRGLLAVLPAVAAVPVAAESSRRFAVVGAGIAGLAAAQALTLAGHGVVVFEARGRIGGRVFTSRDLGFPAEIGANWVHGDRSNPLMKLAHEAGASSFSYDFDDWRIIAADGTALSTQDDQAWQAVSERLSAVLGEASEEEDGESSVLDWLEDDKVFARLADKDAAIANAVLRRELLGDYGADGAELSAEAWNFGKEFKGDDMLVTNGFDRIVHHLAEGLDIRSREPVTGIRHGETGAEIVTANGRATFDAVIVTVPLGVLKAGGIRFDPPLSNERKDRIDRMGFGAFEKAFLTLDRPFDLGAVNVSVTGDNPWCNLIDLSDIAGQPAVLAYCGGSDAREAVSASDAHNRDWLLANVRAASGDMALAPTGFQMSRWLTDPYSLGSYSFPALGSQPGDAIAIAAAESPSLHFAGEAYSAYPSTVHGALLSGRAAARALTDG